MSHWICSWTCRSRSFLQLITRNHGQGFDLKSKSGYHWLINEPSERSLVGSRTRQSNWKTLASSKLLVTQLRQTNGRGILNVPQQTSDIKFLLMLKPSRSANVVIFYGETSGIHRIEVNSVRGIWFARRRSRCPQADRNHAVVEPFWINPFEVSWTIKTILSINILYLFIIK